MKLKTTLMLAVILTVWLVGCGVMKSNKLNTLNTNAGFPNITIGNGCGYIDLDDGIYHKIKCEIHKAN